MRLYRRKRSEFLFLYLFVMICVYLWSIVFFSSISSAQEFTATTIGDYGNATVMEVTGNYDAKNPDGTLNSEPRQAITKEFLRTHKDEYDFLVIFSNFDFQMPETEVEAFYLHVKNDTQGIGKPLSDNTSFFGSDGKLQGTIDMGNISTLVTDPLDPKFEETLGIISHEQMHRWGAYVKFKDSNGNISTALLGKDNEHWSFLLNSYASVLYGNQWQDNGDGTFTSINARKYYSPLDLYLMGFYDRSQVPSMLLIDNPDIDPARMPEVGTTISGTPKYITIDDIIAAEGERIPYPSDSQKTFKTAFILITTPGTFTGYELYGMENIRNGWVTRFSVLTDGKGILQVATTLREDIPVNPGPVLPPITPRTLPPNIEDGVSWLMNNQGIDGSWGDLSETAARDTSETVYALKNFPVAEQNYSIGLLWLNNNESKNIDYLSRKIETLVNSGQDITTLVNELLSRQNPDGGWGSNTIYRSNPIDTSFALNVLSVANYSDQSVISSAIEYLKTGQNPDGGWGGDDEGSTIEATANVLSAFNKYLDIYQLEDQISRGIAWLLQRQNPDGGFGNSPSTTYDTAISVFTLKEFNVSKDSINSAVNYILNNQSEDGSWYGSAYETALAINTIWKESVEPDLSILADSITVIPPSITYIPTNIVLNAAIWNLGRTDVPQAKVVLYDGAIAEANKISEQTLAFPGQSSVTVTFSVTIPDGNEHRFYVSVDPDNLVRESNETNNIALNILKPETTYDFEILPSDVTVSQSPIDIFQDVKITSKITNKGTMNAYNVQIKYYIDESGAPFDIATSTVNIQVNSTITNEIIWRTNKAGENLPITVFVDPFNSFTEISETNNTAVTYLTVNGSTEPNLTVSYKDIVITPSPVNERGNVNISALMKNEGFSPASNIKINFYKGTPNLDGVLLGSQIIQSLNPGESIRVSTDWTNIMESGERIIYVKVDPDNQVEEIREDDNDAFTTLKILSLPDLAISTNSIVFTPPAPKEGDTVFINVTVQNKGEQSASNITVNAYEGSTLIGFQTIESISGNSQASVSFTYDTTGKNGIHQITIVVDPANIITEQSDDNNSAFRTFGVQDANLWLTEQYISPNGDGIKDNTQFFFRLSSSQTVKVIVVNGKGETVRTFSGSEFNNTSGGNVTWNGLDENGMVVDDGQYQIRVVNINNNVLGSLLVIVDNNRSPLTDAIGTKYLLNSNLTCMLPDIWEDSWQWFPDESGILFRIHSPDQNTPEYPTGLYTMSPDGNDILRIIPWEWSYGIDPTYDYFINDYSLSRDGEKIAFILGKFNKLNSMVELNQLWIVDRDGKNLTLIDSYDLTQDPYSGIGYIKLSPTGEYIVYMGDNPAALWIIKSDGSGKTKIDPDGGYIDFSYVTWSPDSQKIAYVVDTCIGWSCVPKVRISDVSGNRKVIFTMTDYGNHFEWLDNQKIVLSMPRENEWSVKTLWLVDTSGAGNHKELTDNLQDEIAITLDRKTLAFANTVNDTAYVNIADTDGNISVIHEFNSTVTDYSPQIRNILWSSDGSKLAFIEGLSGGGDFGECVDCAGSTEANRYYLVVIDMKTKKEASFEVASSLNLGSWLSDNITILGYSGDFYYDSDLTAINSGTGETISLISHVIIPWQKELVSPLERYITYYKEVDLSSACYGKGYEDLWAMSSLLNLTSDLRTTKEKSAIILKGIAADLNFEGYTLEYADTNDPNTWNLIAPPSNIPVVNDVFTTWIPPYEGTFYVRLTVRDKAGNTVWSRKRVSWGLSSSITNLYKSRDSFSPNGDGVKDTVELHYTVLEPFHLEFNIYDENNNLLRTFLKDYTAYAVDYITWDGRDENGMIVPDGIYKIRVFDYEFFVEVDNTHPDVGVGLSEILQDVDLSNPEDIGTLKLYVRLDGHAVDNNLKNWIVEYGEGDNPQEWYEYISGEDQLAKKDEDGNLILDPIKNDTIGKYEEAVIEWFVGKKFRITAEDFAGNRSTAITDFLEERIALYTWDKNRILLGKDQEGNFVSNSVINADLAKPGLHILELLETIGLSIVSMNVQYLSNRQWFDSPPIENPPSGEINLEWDNSGLNQVVDAVRIKAVDILGQEHYTNTVQTEEAFGINTCDLTARNSLFEDLEVLKFQVRSDQDIRYSQWTDYKIFDSTKGDQIPVGTFNLPLPPIESGLKYEFRMIGIGISGKEYIGESNDECTEFVKFSLNVNYNEADCGLLSDGKAVLSVEIENLSSNISLRTLSYYIQKPEGLQLLQEFDIAKEGLRSVTVETLNMPEGSYPVKATLSYLNLNNNATKEESATNTLIVDRVLPTAQITYPAKSLMLCPIKISDSKGDWFGIPVEGTALDNINVKRYDLYYGIGENPTSWIPTTTRNSKGEVKYITGKGSIKGQIGIWDVTNLKGTSFALKLKVIDVAGNVSCYTTSFSVDNLIEITDLVIDKSLFSPNNDGIFDDLKIGYQIDEYATVDVKVFPLIEETEGSYSLGSDSVRTIVSGLQHLGGTENTSWDGKDDPGAIVSDGLYAIAVLAIDSCGNTNMDWIDVEIDNSPPVTIITYPGPPDPVGNIVEVKGTADDFHFEQYTLESGQGDNPDTWLPISSNTIPVQDNILGTWNTFGLDGRWTIRLTAVDVVGNQSNASVTIDLGLRKDLIKDLTATPRLFSPNNDGKLDTVNINYELTDACQVQIDIIDSIGAVKKNYITITPSAGTYSFIWDGKDTTGAMVLDGVYTVKLTVALSSNPSLTQEEALTLFVDSTPPIININQPLNNSYLKGNIAVTGTIIDSNLIEYSISYTGAAGAVILDKANQNRENYTFGVISGIPEGNYTLTVKAKDLGENTTEKNIAFVIDKTPPKVAINTPGDGEYYGFNKGIINISGTITEANLEIYNLRYGSGDNPLQWIGLQSGNTIPVTEQLFSWNVGKDSGIPDGLNTLSLYAQDKAGLTGETKVRITVDNTMPEVAITSPQDGSYVRAPIDIKGTASDSNLDKYTLELSEGQCSNAFKWAVIRTSATSVRDGTISSWQGIPSDGDYCLRLTVNDKTGNISEAKVNVKVDTQPPAPPMLSGVVEDKSNSRLNWTQNTETDLAGYNIYRDSQKINTALISEITYLDQNLKEGDYGYTITAVDPAGNESGNSNEVRLKIDITGPDAKIRSPQDGSMVSGLIDIKGTAYSSDDFKQYRVSIGQGSSPSSWNLIRTSPVSVSYGSLTQWDTIGLNGLYSIRLESEDISGNINTHQIVITIDDIPPAPPVLISAIPDSSDIALTWLANTEPDLAGYLLFRNSQLANVSGIVIGDLTSYLISGITYLDKSLPDGRFNYYLIAMDQAGNLSDQSNALEVTIDTHPPHAEITDPLDGAKFQNKIMIKAESADIDIALIQFQYKSVNDEIWINLGGSVSQLPYITYLDPVTPELSYGDYNLRAVATDTGGKTDPAPSSITVTYTDLTSPDAPQNLKAQMNGRDVTLTWDASSGTDIDGYNIYRISESVKAKINTAIVKETTYQDRDLSDGQYTYEATAVDVNGNESEPSNSATARVYAPIISQPYTPVDKDDIQITGSNTTPDSTVEIFIDMGSGQISQGTTPSDAQGNFFSTITLSLGENKITAKATDSAGNISRSSEMVVVVYNEPPSPPAGLTTSVQDYDVTLAWNPNTESDLSGYNLYRNEEMMNLPVAVTSGQVSASSSYYYNPPSYAFDSNPSTYWMPSYSYEIFNPVWWQIDLPSPELINHIEIHWESDSYAGRDYEIQVWSGYAWITQVKVTGNDSKDNTFDFKPSYRTDRIRLYIIETTDTNYSKNVRISEIVILRDDLITQTSYNDLDLLDGEYNYKITAIDYYGFESSPSEEGKAIVGDVVSPDPPQNLTATASGSNVILVWSPNSETDLAGYNAYRNTSQGWQKINTSLLTETTYTDINLLNGIYTYRVTAVDTVGNESLPSNEATVSVSIALLQPPINLYVSTIPEGASLSISWEYPEGDAAGYNLYRSSTSGGPYTKVNSSQLNNTVYLDTGLTNGVAYYYVVTAVDSVGNKSAYSNEAMGIPSDAITPSRPGIFFPTISGMPVVLYKDKTDISGIAEPASTVELFKDGDSAGRTFALDNDMIQSFAIDDNIWDMAISPDGKTLAYQDNGSLWLKTLSTGNTVNVIQEGYSPAWSPDGSKIAYLFTDNSGNTRIGIYDIGKVQIIPLTDDTYVYEQSPSWSFDRGKIAFISNRGGSDDVWIKDLNSGSLTQATHSGYPSYPRLSPDGKKLAYFEYQNLYIADLSTGDTLMVDDNTDWYSIDWSPDSKKILFRSYANGNGDAFVYDLDNNEETQITESDNGINYPMWSPDGNTVVYVKYEPDWSASIWITSSNIQDQRRLLPQNLYNLNYLSWVRSGGIAYRDQQDVLNIIYLNGHFSFEDIQVDPGENVFYATATDSSGNTSQPSEEISVTFDASLMPDLAVTDDDIFIYPPYPIRGQETMITVFIKNKGSAEGKDVGTDIYLWDSQGNITLLKSENISSIAPQSEEYISLTLDTTSMTGANKIIAVADPLDKIYEVIETDNLAIKEFLIAEGEGITLTTNLDNSQYSSNQDVHINIVLRNSGPERNGVLQTWIEDDSGYPVILIDERAVSMPYADEKQYNFIWNTGNTYAGPYRVHTIFKDGSDVITEGIVPFTIIPDINIDSSVVTNKIAYGSNEDVSMTINIKNNGNNYVIPRLDVKVKVMDAFNNALFNDNKNIINLLPGASDNINSTWNTGLAPAGNYTIVVEIYRNDELILSKSALFVVNASSIITGSITVSPAVVLAGSNAQVGYVVQNTGNTAMNGLSLNIFIIDPGTQTVMSTYVDMIDLGMNTTKSGGFTFSTQGYALKTYTALLQYVYQGSTKTLATASFTAKDGLPPVVNIVSPVSGNSYNSTVDITIIAADDVSGVDRVEYQIDSRGWRSLPIADPTTGRYSTSWAPSAEDGGLHTISVRATDKAGNTSAVISVTITVTLSPPTGTIAINNNDSYTKDANVTLTLHAIDSSGSAVANMCISNTTSCTAWEDYTETKAWTLTPGDGTKTVYVWYQDNLGNTDTVPYSDSITLDTTPPLLTVSTLSDGSWTNNEILNVSGEVTDNTGIEQITINEEVVTINPDWSFSYPVVLQDGPNTIIVKAVDLAGNEASDTRTINLDRNAPIITITTPADNIKTNQSSIDVTGTIYEESTVTVKVNDAAPVPAVMEGNNFSLTVTLLYGINTIEVTATDIAGNTSTVKRTVTFDDLNPSLSVTDPAQDVKTDHADMIIRGEVDDLTAVTVTITMDGNIYAPLVTGGQFEQPVTFTEEKTYQIYLKAVDEAGNETLVQRNVVYDITAPMVTLDPVTSPTNVNSQVLTGTMETGATVSVTCPTATVGTVTYPTDTTWTAELSNMQEGDNAIAIIATDEAGNTSSPEFATIIFSAGNSVVNTCPATLWIGLKNSDDQGTQFDLRTELYINGVKISDGETLCITGVTRNPSYAKEVTVPFNPISNGDYASGDILSLKVLTRIGTTPDGLKCTGPGGSHNNAVGLRLYYDAPDRPSRFSYETVQNPMQYLFLHSSGTNYFLDNVPPTGAVKYKDSSGVNYNNGNPWKEIGTWTTVLQ